MDKETKMMFNSVLEEMAKMEERINERFDTMERRFEKMENHIELLHHEVNACKLERESVGLLIKKIDQSEARIEELEKKIA